MRSVEEVDYEELLEDCGALASGHFRLSSGRHSDRYLQCQKAFQFPAKASVLGHGVAGLFNDERIDVVIGPAMGAVVLAMETGRAISQTTNPEVRVLFAERDGGRFTLRRGMEIPEGSKVLVVEDVITTGGSVYEVLYLVESAGASPVGIGCCVLRGRANFGSIVTRSLLQLDLPTYSADNCPMCRDALPLVRIGQKRSSP